MSEEEESLLLVKLGAELANCIGERRVVESGLRSGLGGSILDTGLGIGSSLDSRLGSGFVYDCELDSGWRVDFDFDLEFALPRGLGLVVSALGLEGDG